MRGNRNFLALLALVLLTSPATGDELAYPPEQHAWGGFPVNSWKFVRTTSETLNSQEQVTNVTVTDTRTTLVAVDAASYTLRNDIVVDVAGRRIATTPQVVKYGFYGESPGKSPTIKRLGEAPLVIDGRSIPCELRQVVLDNDNGKLVSTLHYSPDVAPFILRRESALENGGEEKKNSALVEVIALDLPQRIRGELKQASYVKTTQKLAQGTKVTLEVHCEDVPGGVSAHWSSETDSSGRVVRRSTLELIGYGLPAPVSEAPLAWPRRPHRANKAARRMDGR